MKRQFGIARRKKTGAILIVVILVAGILWFALAAFLVYMRDSRIQLAQRLERDRALMVAEAGLAQGIAWLDVQGLPPNSHTVISSGTDTQDQGSTLAAGDGEQSLGDGSSNAVLSPDSNYSLRVEVYPEDDGAKRFWTVVSSASYNGKRGIAKREFTKRVQTTISQENFAKFEYFVDYGPVWTSGYLHFQGFNKVYFGPMHTNSGVGLWPNLWFVDQFSSSAPGNTSNPSASKVRVYPNYNSYVSGVYRKNDAINYVNIMQYYNSKYKHEPKFYKGLRVRDKPIQMPDDLNIDPRAQKLRDNAGLILPDDYTNYSATKGSKFEVKLVDPTGANNDGEIHVRQYRGKDNDGNPLFGDQQVFTVTGINNAMIVYGDIVSLEGTLDGRLTIAGFKNPSGTEKGKIQVTDDVEYESRLRDDDFRYSDAPDLFTDNGADVNLEFVKELKGQVYALDDILGVVSEADVTVPERDLEGNRIADGYDDSLYLDMIVMATGQSTSSSSDGSYFPENMLNRPTGSSHRLGGVIQNRAGSWALFTSGNHAAGLTGPSIWDFRAVLPDGAPPFFPTTGDYEYHEGTWRETFVSNPEETPWLPVASQQES